MDNPQERQSGFRTACDYYRGVQVANRKRLELPPQISKTECSMMNYSQHNQRKEHQQRLLRHTRHRSIGVNEFKIKLHRQMLDKLERDEDQLKRLTISNQQTRMTRQRRIRDLKSQLRNSKVAEVRLLKQTFNVQKRKSMQKQRKLRESKMVLRKRDRLMGDYTVCNINSEVVQSTYITQMDKHLTQLPTRLRRMENLMRIRGSSMDVAGFQNLSFL